MLYKIGSMGYFGGVAKVSRGPWFRDYFVEDDGLDWFYSVLDNDGNKCYLLSNNLKLEDRERMAHMYHTMVRNNRLSWVGGLWLGFEMVARHPYLKSMALGWRATSMVGLGFLFKSAFMQYSSQQYNPIVGAFFRKYSAHVKSDLFEIKDEKKEYFYIDTSEYMNYSNATLGEEFHSHHGPQPEGEAMDSSWLTEVDKFLAGEENNLRNHKRFLNFDFKLADKSYPSSDAVADLMHKKE